MTTYGVTRVSTGSQDAATQRKAILAYAPDAIIIECGVASASKGQHLDKLDQLVATLRRDDRVIVTDSSRLDRDPDQWAQMARLVQIKLTGADVVDLSNPSFGADDRFGVVMTALHQMESADKSRTVKHMTNRGVQQIIANRAAYGPLPSFWTTVGERYAKQAVCADTDAVRDIYTRIADGESLASVGRIHDLYPQSVKRIVSFEASHTGVMTCTYSHDGVTESWTHDVTPVVDSPLWWRANKQLDSKDGNLKGGRWAANWISGVLDCPGCGGHLYLNAGNTPQGRPRTPKLRCGGKGKNRLSCGYKGTDSEPIAAQIDEIFQDDTPILAFQRITGNAHVLEELKAELRRIQARLSATEDDDELDALVTQRKAVKGQIEAFEIIPDSFDYAPTGQTIADMWNTGDDTVKRGMVKSIAGWLSLGDEGIAVLAVLVTGEVADLGNGLCFRAGDVLGAIGLRVTSSLGRTADNG